MTFFASLRSLMLVAILLSTVQAQTIPIEVDTWLPDARPGTPVRFGLPMPKGHLLSAAGMRVVDDQGNTVPHQHRVTATWNPSGSEGIRWLLVDMLVDPARRYALVIDGATPPAESTSAVARLEGDHILIDTGPLTGQINLRNGFDLFTQLQCFGEPVVKTDPAHFSGFYVEHETRGVFRADFDKQATIELEETGPVHAIIKAQGWYVNDAGERFCRYSIRAHFFKGRSDIRLEHTFIYTGISQQDRLRSVSMALVQEPGKTSYLGGEDIDKGQILTSSRSPGWYLQDAHDHEHIELLAKTPDNPQPIRLANKAGGWITYDQATVAIRDAWQQYPWELEVDGPALRVHLWPRHGRLLDTSWDGQWWFLSDRQKEAMVMTKPRMRGSAQDRIAHLRANTKAVGAAKTHELWLSFTNHRWRQFPDAMHRSAAGLAREVAYPTLANADLDWTTRSRALDFVPHAPPYENWREADGYLQDILAMVDRLTQENKSYGWWDWGAYHQHPYDDRLQLDAGWQDNHGLNTWHRANPKSHYSWGILPWNQYFRTHQRDWLRYAQTYTLYSADRAHVHHTDQGRVAGAEYHYDNSEIHWLGGWSSSPGGDIPSANLQYKGDYLAMYWLTGDRRALDVLEMWGRMILERTAGGDTWGTWGKPFADGNEIRNAGMQLHRLMTLYQATWDERYRQLATRMVDSFLAVKDLDTLIACEMHQGGRFHNALGWAHEGLWLYWNLTQDERIQPVLLLFINRARDYDAGLGYGYGPLRALTYGYLLTHDAAYLDLGRGIVDHLLALGAGPSAWSAGTQKFDTVSLSLFMGTMAEADEDWRRRNLPLHLRGNTLTYRYAPQGSGLEKHGANVYFRENDDQAWQVHAAFNLPGEMQIIAPDGSVAAAATIDPQRNKRVVLDVPADGQTGDYTLICSRLDEQASPREPRVGRIVQSTLPFVYEGAHADYTQPTGIVRRAYVVQPENQALTLRTEWRTEGRRLEVIDPLGMILASTATSRALGDGTHLLTVPPSSQARELALQLSGPTYRMQEISYPMRMLVTGAPHVLAVNPGQWFLPITPASRPELSPQSKD